MIFLSSSRLNDQFQLGTKLSPAILESLALFAFLQGPGSLKISLTAIIIYMQNFLINSHN